MDKHAIAKSSCRLGIHAICGRKNRCNKGITCADVKRYYTDNTGKENDAECEPCKQKLAE